MKARESATNEREKRVLAAKTAVETRKCPELGTAHQKSIMTTTRALLVRSREPQTNDFVLAVQEEGYLR